MCNCRVAAAAAAAQTHQNGDAPGGKYIVIVIVVRFDVVRIGASTRTRTFTESAAGENSPTRGTYGRACAARIMLRARRGPQLVRRSSVGNSVGMSSAGLVRISSSSELSPSPALNCGTRLFGAHGFVFASVPRQPKMDSVRRAKFAKVSIGFGGGIESVQARPVGLSICSQPATM